MAFDYFWIGAGLFVVGFVVLALITIFVLGFLFGGGKKGLDPKKLARASKRMFPAKGRGIYAMNSSGQAFIPIGVVVLSLFLIVAFTVGGIITAVYAAIYFFGGSIAMILGRTILGRAQDSLKTRQGKSIGRFKMP